MASKMHTSRQASPTAAPPPPQHVRGNRREEKITDTRYRLWSHSKPDSCDCVTHHVCVIYYQVAFLLFTTGFTIKIPQTGEGAHRTFTPDFWYPMARTETSTSTAWRQCKNMLGIDCWPLCYLTHYHTTLIPS